MLTSAIGQGLGMSTDAAYRLGGALGIAAVAVNTWVSHWEDVKEIFSGDWTYGASGVIRNITDALLTGAASLANFDRLLGKVSLTTADLKRNQKGLADRAAQKAGIDKAATDADSVVLGVHDEGAESRGTLFREALKKYGGGDKLRNEMLGAVEAKAIAGAKNRVKANPNLILADEIDKAKKQALDSVNLEIANAIKGESGAIERIAKGRPGLPGVVDLEQAAIEAKGLEHDRQFREKQRRLGLSLTEQGRQNELAMNEERAQAKDRESSRFAGALSSSVGKGLLQNSAMSDDELQRKVKKAMERAGIAAKTIGETLEMTAKKLRDEMKEKVAARALDRGITEGAAAQQLLKEQQAQDRANQEREHPKPELLSTESYLNKLLVSSQVKKDDNLIPQEQLQVQKNMVVKLDEVKQAIKEGKAAPAAARFAARGAR